MAVSRALTELERYALSRQHGGHEWVITGDIVATRFDHIAARPSKGADDGYGPDPHLHTHVVIANMTSVPTASGVDSIRSRFTVRKALPRPYIAPSLRVWCADSAIGSM